MKKLVATAIALAALPAVALAQADQASFAPANVNASGSTATQAVFQPRIGSGFANPSSSEADAASWYTAPSGSTSSHMASPTHSAALKAQVGPGFANPSSSDADMAQWFTASNDTEYKGSVSSSANWYIIAPQIGSGFANPSSSDANISGRY